MKLKREVLLADVMHKKNFLAREEEEDAQK